MFCTTCGKKLEEGTKFCIYCGAKQEDAPAPAAESAVTAPVYESTASVEERPAPEAPAFETPTPKAPSFDVPPVAPAFETPTPKAPSFDVPPVAPVFDEAPVKKEGKGKKIALIAVIGVLILALIGLNAYQYFVMTPKTADKLADAASLTHMMNANTFTAGAYHLNDKSDMDTVVSDLKDNIMNRQWMCGFPDKLVVLTYDQYVVSLYGDEDLVDTFRDKFTAAYGDASVAYDEAIL